MSVHTYVGARYVPRFMGTYDATQQYEALDVVDNGLGTSYIARNIVPAGTPLTDTDHWFVYGASSGAIIQLQNDMIQAQNDITGLQGDVTGLLTDVGTLKTKTAKNLLVIGNSYVQRGCADKLEALYDTYKEYVHGGSGIVGRTSNPYTYQILLDDAIIDPNLDNNDITDIIFVVAMGDSWAFNEKGQNDYRTELDLQLGQISTKIGSNFLNCKHIMVTLAEGHDRVYWSDLPHNACFAIHKFLKHLCPVYDMIYLGWTGWNAMLTNSGYFESDDFHPTATGADFIGQEIVNAYLGNLHYRVKEGTKQVPFLLTNASGTCRLVSQVLPDEVTFSIGYSSISAAAPIVGANDLVIELGGAAFPPVAPVNQTLYLQTSLINPNGDTRLGGFSMKLANDTHGVGQIYIDTAPAATVIGSSGPKMPGLVSVNYKL